MMTRTEAEVSYPIVGKTGHWTVFRTSSGREAGVTDPDVMNADLLLWRDLRQRRGRTFAHLPRSMRLPIIANRAIKGPRRFSEGLGAGPVRRAEDMDKRDHGSNPTRRCNNMDP